MDEIDEITDVRLGDIWYHSGYHWEFTVLVLGPLKNQRALCLNLSGGTDGVPYGIKKQEIAFVRGEGRVCDLVSRV